MFPMEENPRNVASEVEEDEKMIQYRNLEIEFLQILMYLLQEEQQWASDIKII